jgi:HEAT repeat protein
VIPVLTGILDSSDSSIRNATIAALVNIQTKVEKHFLHSGNCLPSIKISLQNGDLVEHLLHSLQEQDLEIRKNAIIALGWLREERAVKDLLEILNEYDLEEYVVGSLVSIGEKALPDLIKALQNPDPKIKGSAIRCLGWIENLEGIKSCLPFLKDKNAEIRYQAIMAMSVGLEDPEIENALLDQLSEPEPEVRGTLVEVLGKSKSAGLAAKLVAKFPEADHRAKLSVIQTLARLKNSQARQSLLEILQTETGEVRSEAFKALISICADEFEESLFLIGASDPDPSFRKTAAGYLRFARSEKIETLVMALMQDSNPEVRIEAIASLGSCRNFSIINGLIENFAKEDRRMQLAIIKCMGGFREKTYTQFLIDQLKQSDPDLKRASAESLGKIRDSRAVPELLITLEDPDWGIRIAAIRALAEIGDRRCVSYLLDKLGDPEILVQKEIITALGALGTQESVNFILPLIFNENLQMDILDALVKLGIPDMKYYFDFLGRGNTKIKGILVDLLGRLKEKNAVDYLCSIMENEFFTVRVRMAKTLGEINDRRAIPCLLKVFKEDPSEEVRREAAGALKRLDAKK